MKRTPLRKVSKKRAKENREYAKLRKEFLGKRKYCEIFETLSFCTRQATEIHHMNGREGKRLLDSTWWLPSCRNCHRWLHDHPRFARDAGFLV